MNAPDFASDIPADIARAAHQWTSHVPEQRGEQERAGYVATLTEDYETLARYADTDDKRAALAEEFTRYRAGYRKRFLARLYARSRCASTMVTGGSNFPTARNDKRNRAADRVNDELVTFRQRALDAIRRVLQPELRPIMTGDADAVTRLREKLIKAEALQAQMKSANAAIRKHAKAGEAAQVAALAALGFPESIARELLKPDFAGRIGFPDYAIRNNGAAIRQMQARLPALEKVRAALAIEVEGVGGVRLEDAPAENRVRLFFPGKPDASVRDGLKSRGFRWTPSLGCWQAYRNSGSLEHARTVAGVG